MTDRMEEQAEAIFAEIDGMGEGSILEGVLAGIERGGSSRRSLSPRSVSSGVTSPGDLARVGVNAFVDPDDEPVDTLVIGPEGERAQVERWHRCAPIATRWRFGRPSTRWSPPRGTDANLIPHPGGLRAEPNAPRVRSSPR